MRRVDRGCEMSFLCSRFEISDGVGGQRERLRRKSGREKNTALEDKRCSVEEFALGSYLWSWRMLDECKIVVASW